MTAVDKKKWEQLLQAVEQNLKYLMNTDIVLTAEVIIHIPEKLMCSE